MSASGFAAHAAHRGGIGAAASRLSGPGTTSFGHEFIEIHAVLAELFAEGKVPMA